jgi:phage-related protein
VQSLTPVIVPLIGILGKLLQETVIPLLPIIVQLAGMLGSFLGQALKELLPPVGQVAISLVKILIAITPLLPPLLKLVSLVIELALKALMPLIGLVAKVAELFTKYQGVLATVIGAIAKFIAKGLDWIENFGRIRTAVSDAFDWIRQHWPLLLAILTGPIGLAVYFITGHWREIVSGAERMFHDVVNFFEQLPHRILSGLGDFGHLLWNAGVSVIDGLLNGIESAVGGVLSEVGHIGSDISGAFSKVLGIFSPSRVFFQHGVNTLLGYINGVRSVAPQVRAAMAAVAGTVGSGGLTGVGAAAAGMTGGAPNATVNIKANFMAGTQQLQSPQFLQYLQATVQEAVLRWAQNNPGTGFVIPGRG